MRLDPLTVSISSGRIVGCVIAAGALNPVAVFDEAVAQDRGGHTQDVYKRQHFYSIKLQSDLTNSHTLALGSMHLKNQW